MSVPKIQGIDLETGKEFNMDPVTNDGKAKVTIADTTPDTLNEKVSVVRGLTKSVTSPGGDESLELGLPTGTNKYLLRFDGTNWVPCELIQLNTTNVTGQYLMTFDGTTFFLGRDTGTTSTRHWIKLDTSGVKIGAGTSAVFSTSILSGLNTASIAGYRLSIAVNDWLQIQSTTLGLTATGVLSLPLSLNGTGNRPVYADSVGKLIPYTNNLVIKQVANVADGTASYQLTDLTFVADPNRQHVVKYQLELLTAVGQDVRIILTTADSGMTASGTAKSKSPAEFMRMNDNGTSFFMNLDYGNYIDITLRAGAFPNFVELEFYILPTVATPIQLAFSQVVADAVNPITLKASSRMYMQR